MQIKMSSCIWKTSVEDRRCEYCSYRGGCERYPKGVEKEDVRSVADRYVRAMSEIVGQDILMRTRSSLLVWARNMVAYQMRLEGYSVTAVGDRLGLNHSTVTHCKSRVEEMLSHPMFYPRETRIWQKFKETLSL